MKQLFNFLLHAPFTAWIGTLIVLLLMAGIIWLIGLMLMPLLKGTRVEEVYHVIINWWDFRVVHKKAKWDLGNLKWIESQLVNGQWKRAWFRKFYLRLIKDQIKKEAKKVNETQATI